MRNTLTRRGPLAAIALFSVGLWVLPALAGHVPNPQNVAGHRETPKYTHDGKDYGPYAWDYSYIRKFDGTKVVKDIEIDFKFPDGWDDAKKNAYKAAVEAGVEKTWNNKYKIKDPTTGKEYAAAVDLTLTGPFNQTVNVHDGSGRADMLNWYAGDMNNDSVNAHEFGHMMGLFDEYIGGAVNQYPDPLLSNDGLMGLGALNPNPVMYARYYQQFADYMNQLNHTTNYRLVAVPLPSVAGLFPAGAIMLLLVRRRSALKAA